MPIPSLQIIRLARLLEKAGFEDAYDFVRDILVPLVEKRQVNLHQLMYEYANSAEDQDTAHYQLHLALTKIPGADLDFLGSVVEMDREVWQENWERYYFK